MKANTLVSIVMLALVLFVGINDKDVHAKTSDMMEDVYVPIIRDEPSLFDGTCVGLRGADLIYIFIKQSSPFLSLIEPVLESKEFSSASGMRDIALAYGRGTIEYTVLIRSLNGDVKFPYLFATQFDAVSNVLYNISYLFSIPSKFVYAFRGNIDGGWYITGPLFLIFAFAWGSLAVMIMIVPSFIIGFIFHPINSILNLTIYIFGSLYDLFWGAILSPLLDTFILMFKTLPI